MLNAHIGASGRASDQGGILPLAAHMKNIGSVLAGRVPKRNPYRSSPFLYPNDRRNKPWIGTASKVIGSR